MGVKDRQNGLQLRVAFVGDVDELGGHARIDVHLGVAHVGHQFDAHHLHLVVHQIAGPVTRVCGEHHFGAGVGFDGVHHLQGLHLEAFRNLQRDEAVVAILDALHQLLELEIVTVEVHGAPEGPSRRPVFKPCSSQGGSRRARPPRPTRSGRTGRGPAPLHASPPSQVLSRRR